MRLAPVVALLVLSLAACSAPTPQQCQRYEGLALTPENGFSGRLDWKDARTVDMPSERVEVAISAVRPTRGPIELVHVIGNTEADHWMLTLPDFHNAPVSLCTIQLPGAPPSCGATLENAPFSPGGYYYLRSGENRVLEAGISFVLCE